MSKKDKNKQNSQEKQIDIESDAFFETPHQEVIPEEPNRRFFHIILFALLLLFVLFPYLKQQFPALEKRVDKANYLERQGDQEFEQKTYKKAIQAYLDSLKSGTLFSTLRGKVERSRVHYKLALCNLHLKNQKQAIVHAEKTIALNPNWQMPLPYEMLLFLYNKTHQLVQLYRIAQLYQTKFSTKWRTWAMLGNTFTQMGLFKKAISYYQKGLKKIPQNAGLLGGLARAIMFSAGADKKLLLKALQLAEQAQKISKGQSFGILDTLAELYLRLKQPKKALKFAKQGVQITIKKPRLHNIAKKRLTKIQKAIKEGQSQTYFIVKITSSRKNLTKKHKAPIKKSHVTTDKKKALATTKKVVKAKPTSKKLKAKPTSKKLKQKPTTRRVLLRGQKKNQATSRPNKTKIQKPLTPRYRPHFIPVPIPKKKSHGRSRHLISPL